MGRESIYWFVVFLTFLYIFYKNRSSSLKILIVLCFYSGLAAFLGKNVENPYKIVLVLLSLYLLFKTNSLNGLDRRTIFFLIMFVLFSVSFLFSAFVNGDYFNLVFSQYGKYVTPVCLFLVFLRTSKKYINGFIHLEELFLSLLIIQVILSAFKILIIGLHETTVGSIAYLGGGPATMLPVLGFLLIWIYKNGKLIRTDWIYIFLFLFIAFASLKRAIWFIMPVVMLYFTYYVRGRAKLFSLLYIIPLGILIFYAGIRLNPTLNKEGKIGGSFDFNYVLNYTQNYTFGKTSETSEVQLGKGRGGATFLLWNRLLSDKSLSFTDYWGFGLKEVYTTDYEEFNETKYGVNSKGSVTGIFQSYISAGFVGVVLTTLIIIATVLLIKDPRVRYGIAILMFWDYLFYSGLILRSQPLFILLFYIIVFSNLQSQRSFNSKNISQRSSARSKDLRNLPVRA
jgi:hypothetical protein